MRNQLKKRYIFLLLMGLSAGLSGCYEFDEPIGGSRIWTGEITVTKIAFHSIRDGQNEIYIMNIDGTEQTRLTNNPANDGNPSFSPDGNKIAFSSNRDVDWEIYIMNVDGTGQTNLSNNA
ncbi:MAG: hypothetical protein OEZ36_11740, partial [Spirochaetota bacterium]|nr:hypothetical protein [Spirochaetota bacterium]